MKKVVILTGAGISAESGISTFRDSGGLWEQHSIEDIATYEGWLRNRQLVLDFYNQRRKQLQDVEPNEAHRQLVRLESHYDVEIITQNVDDLHERAGSSKVTHLHGELKKVRSEKNPNEIITLDGWELKEGMLASDGSQLRPHIVWFGEAVPMMDKAMEITRQADIFLVVGTSLNVYPAAGLIDFVGSSVPKYIIDPNDVKTSRKDIRFIKERASIGVEQLVNELIDDKFCQS